MAGTGPRYAATTSVSMQKLDRTMLNVFCWEAALATRLLLVRFTLEGLSGRPHPTEKAH
jgi:hypothetical protein